MFVVGTIFFACCMAMGIAQQEDTFVVCVFGFFFFSWHSWYSKYDGMEIRSQWR